MDKNEAVAIQEMEIQVQSIPGQAHLVVVTDNDSMTLADNTKGAIKDMIKEIDATFKPLADKAFQAHRAITGKWKEVKAPLEEADIYLTGQVKGYLRKLEEIRQAEERKLREEARKQEEERRLAEALQAEQEGKQEEAQAILEEETFVPPPVVKSEAPKVDNRQYRTIPRARVTDKIALIKYVATHPMFADMLDINQGVINRKASSLGKEINNISGLEYYEE